MADNPRSSDYPTDRPFQWSDLDRTGQGVMRDVMRDWGKMKSRIGPIIDKLSMSQAATAPKRVAALENIQPYLKDRPITMRGSTQRRVDAMVDGFVRSERDEVPSGAGWYFGHSDAIADSAETYGFSPERAVIAAGAVSPNNSPANEKASTTEVMKRIASGEGVDLDVPLKDRTASDRQIARGGSKVNIRKMAGVLMGDAMGLDGTDLDPLNPYPAAGKVRSYTQASLDALRAGTPVRDEYMGRVRHASDVLTGRQMRGQGRLDLWGLQGSTEGVLSPTRSTAEDTWMTALTVGQDVNTTVGSTNVAKASASDKTLSLDIPVTYGGEKAHPAGPVDSQALLHAWNNEATVRAARKVGEMTGVENFPAIAAQEVPWTEVRRQTDKDPEYNAIMAKRAAADARNRREQSRWAKRQGTLF